MSVFKMRNILIILFLCVVASFGQQSWSQRATVKHHTEFFSQVIQETIYEIERRGFSTLTLLDISHNINETMYRWHVNGTANYTNGFLVSIQKIDLTAMSQSVNSVNIDGVPTPRATVSGTMNMRDVKLGYDGSFYPFIGTVQKFTSDFALVLIHWPISIMKNLRSKEVTVSMTANTSGNNIMVYRPANNITEVISRNFFAYHTNPGVSTWSSIIGPIILDVIKNKVPFPEICYTHC